MNWTTEREELLRKLWAEKPFKSHTLIARTMGGFEHTRDGGRCAISGKANRMRLPLRGRDTVRATQRRAPRGPTRVQRRVKRAVRLLATIGIPPVLSGLECDFGDLQSGSCRWVVTDDKPFLFCGAPKDPESSYCTHHFMRSLRKFGTNP